MAINEEALAAVVKALDAATSADRSDSRKRFLIMLEAALPHLLPAPVAPESSEPEATLLVNFRPADEDKAEVQQLSTRTWALIKKAAPE